MKRRSAFSAVATELEKQHRATYESLAVKPLSLWEPPSVPQIVVVQSDRLLRAEKSVIFCHLWSTVEQQQPTTTQVVTAADVFVQWGEHVVFYFDLWRRIIAGMQAQEATVQELAEILHRKMELDLSLKRVGFEVAKEVRMREKLADERSKIMSALRKEFTIAGEELVMALDVDSVASQMLLFIEAHSAKADVQGLLRILQKWGDKGRVVDTLRQYVTLPDARSYRDLLEAHAALQKQFSPIKDVIPGYFTWFAKVLVEEDLLHVFTQFDLATLNKRIDDRQDEDPSEETGELLAAVRGIGQAFMAKELFCQLFKSAAVVQPDKLEASCEAADPICHRDE